MGIEGRTEAVNERDRAEAGREARARAVRTQLLFHHPQEHAQSSALEIGIAVQEIAQALGHRQHPLPHRQSRQDMIGEMCRRRDHAPGVARWTHAAPLARERDQEVVAALPAAGAGEAMGEDAAFQITAELTLDVGGYWVTIPLAGQREPRLEVFLDAAIEHALARAARPIPRRCAVPGPALDLHACPLCPASRRWGSGWAARYAGRHWPQGLGRAAEAGWLNIRRRHGVARRWTQAAALARTCR